MWVLEEKKFIFVNRVIESCRAGSKWVYEEYLQKKLPALHLLSDLFLLNVKIWKAYN